MPKRWPLSFIHNLILSTVTHQVVLVYSKSHKSKCKLSWTFIVNRCHICRVWARTIRESGGCDIKLCWCRGTDGGGSRGRRAPGCSTSTSRACSRARTATPASTSRPASTAAQTPASWTAASTAPTSWPRAATRQRKYFNIAQNMCVHCTRRMTDLTVITNEL